jgi:hypothetical protein
MDRRAPIPALHAAVVLPDRTGVNQHYSLAVIGCGVLACTSCQYDRVVQGERNSGCPCASSCFLLFVPYELSFSCMHACMEVLSE